MQRRFPLPYLAAASCLYCAFVLSGSRSVAQELTAEDFEKKVEAIAENAMQNEGVTGLSVAVALGSEVYVSGGWGYADFAARKPAKPDSEYRVGSLTTQLVAAAVLQLVEQEKLELDDVITEFFPELEFEGHEVTVAHLLAQTSGIPSYTPLLAPSNGRREEFDVKKILSGLQELPLDSSPGFCFAYSNSNNLLLGLIVEQIAGTSLDEHLAARFFTPLEMEDTTYCFEGPPLSKYADACQEVGGDIVLEGLSPHPFMAEGLCSSVLDLVRWQRGLMDGELFDRKFYDRMVAPGELTHRTLTSYGFGISITPLYEQDCYSYGGGMAGCRVHVAYYPDVDMTVAVIAGDEDAEVDQIERRIARAFFDLPEPGLQDLALTEDERKPYLGAYFIGCTQYIIAERGERLVVLPPDRKAFGLRYQGQHLFVSEFDSEIRLIFQVGDGRATAFILEEHGAQSLAKRM